ncbi:MAG: hypothetical protein HN919_01310 [Verrucomicrobia bacterium]|jgi:hypothetical protein|nr:hypothetical protein [Verrucomicrobiota bacterium]MBT7064915.1 hypothetical protein [Verrucomicrobiota bacterium]MBT7699958.1 hypothetical protein [Verrucomicrobiota bacterium]
MLHDPSHNEAAPEATAITISNQERDTLRRLASELAEIAALPVHAEKARLWTQLNDLDSARPMVWINEICWNEMNVDDELTLQCETPWARGQENGLRRRLYQWRHLPGDMVINDYLTCPLAIHSTNFGIVEDVDIVKTDETSGVVSRHFNVQIQNEDDLDKIQMPTVAHDEEATARRYTAMCEVYDGIMPIKKVGQPHIWFTPWDFLIRWYGIEEAMMDMIDRPDFVHAAVERMVDAWMTELDQFDALNVLSLDNTNTRVGSGGYGYTRQLPGDDYDASHVHPHNMWGCSNAQIFSEVSPQMHWDFAMEHDLRWLARWGMTYYGCCEPLDGKLELLRRIPNLRKISVSPWCNSARAIEQIGADYAISRKPSPAILATDTWHPEQARADIRAFLDQANGECHIELIMKDISTVRYEPQRLWEWASIAMQEAGA